MAFLYRPIYALRHTGYESSMAVELEFMAFLSIGHQAVMVYMGALKMRDWKMREWNYRHQTAGVENARLEISAPCYREWKMRDWNYREQETYGTPRLA